MKIIAFSDNHHHYNFSVSKGDVLAIAGDGTSMGTVSQVTKLNTFIGTLGFDRDHVLFIPGNHDWLFKKDEDMARSIMTNATILIDQGITIDGFNFWGSPFQPEFCSWAFNESRGKNMRKHWDLIPKDTDVLITHSPPYGIMDDILVSGENVGCWDLLSAINRINPKLCLFGHIHRDKIQQRQMKIGNTLFANVSIVDDNYKVVHAPIEINIDTSGKNARNKLE